MAEPDADAVTRPRRRLLAAPFDKLTITWPKIAAGLLIGAVYAVRSKPPGTEGYFFWIQDAPVLVLIVAMTATLGVLPDRLLARFRLPERRTAAWVLGLAALCGVLAALGVGLVFGGYTLALDEFMANFDARIFAGGQFVAPVAPAWQPYVPALQPMFTLPAPDSYWASAYLPVNAAMRALASRIGAEGLVNPLLGAFSVLAVWRVGLRLWPEQPGVALMAAALLGTSAQLIVMSMTAYAMPGHLAFNLAWLWLFLRGGRLGHAGAIVVGFFATGLHQLIFHPLFVGPFILQAWLDRRWRLAALYTLAYAAICGFWFEYWHIVLGLSGLPSGDSSAPGGAWMIERLEDVLAGVRLDNLGKMGESLMRFVTWQSLLTIPLAVVGSMAAIRAKGHLRAMVVGVILTFLAVLILVPTQVHGWGYRYAHGLLGSVCLVAAWSWTRIIGDLPQPRRAAANGAFALACLLSLLVLAPVRVWQAWRFVAPYAAANAEIQAARSPVVIVDHEGSPGFDPGTVVRNDPFLLTRPKVLQLSYMNGPMVQAVCAGGDVRVFNAGNAARIGIDTFDVPTDRHVLALRALMQELHCGQPMP